MDDVPFLCLGATSEFMIILIVVKLCDPSGLQSSMAAITNGRDLNCVRRTLHQHHPLMSLS